MKIPESVRIGGVEYPVIYVDDLNNGIQIAYGHIDYDNCMIELSNTVGTAHEKRCITLWHEILHGIRNHAGLEIENEEEVVHMFAKGIYQVLQDNGLRLFDIESEKQNEQTNARTDAIKEFAEMLKSKTRQMIEYDEGGWDCTRYAIDDESIDNLVKEMTGGE